MGKHKSFHPNKEPAARVRDSDGPQIGSCENLNSKGEGNRPSHLGANHRHRRTDLWPNRTFQIRAVVRILNC
jgi:hypothetical protein